VDRCIPKIQRLILTRSSFNNNSSETGSRPLKNLKEWITVDDDESYAMYREPQTNFVFTLGKYHTYACQCSVECFELSHANFS